ncbi:MAG TPA: class I SAM-dependent methyltransferase [Candidatus Solibacter sp.]|jgi:hypothetical protein|nr:class I SAM-dependent methyltransferase [Candidatus Solibacter sp.]
MNVAELLRDPPSLHLDETGRATSWRLADDVLDFLDRNVTADSRTLETGEGVSTILFALKGASHVCVSPNEYSVQRIRDFCDAHGISTDRVEFTMTPSDIALPKLKGLELDLVLIDGGHGFPIPFLDWHYTAQLLKVGGYVIVDDTQLWTGHVLKEFLMTEPEWDIQSDLHPRSAIFRKNSDGGPGKEWLGQPYVASRSDLPEPGSLRKAWELLRKREYRSLVGKMSRRLLSR